MVEYEATVGAVEQLDRLAHAIGRISSVAGVHGSGPTPAALHAAASCVAPALALVGTGGVSIALGDPSRPALLVSDGDFARDVEAAVPPSRRRPCHEAYRRQRAVVSPDVAHDTRWPQLAAAAAGLGLGSIVAVPLRARGRAVGVLDVYARAQRPPDRTTVAGAGLLAGAVGALVGVLHERGERDETERQLREALQWRPVIDQAKGIVMASARCSAEDAFTRIRSHSRTHNLKVRVVALALVSDPGRVSEVD